MHHAADVEPLGPQDLAELDQGLLVLAWDVRLRYQDEVPPDPLFVAVDVGAGSLRVHGRQARPAF